MTASNLLTMRRLPHRVTDPHDAVIAENIGLRCTVCNHRWSASLGPFRDEIDPKEVACPRADQHEPPEAA